MSDTSQDHTTPKGFWLIAILLVAWNIIGVMNYWASVTATPESLAAQEFNAEQIEFLLAMPSYYAAVFALAVWSGLVGAVLLLLRKALAVPVILFGAVMVILSFTLDFTSGSFAMLGGAYVGIMTVVLIIALFSAWFARQMKARGILS